MSGPWEKFQQPSDGPWSKFQSGSAPPGEASIINSIKQGAGNLLAGGVRGAGSIGATLLWPIDKANDLLSNDRQGQPSRNEQRRADIDEGLRLMGADPTSMLYKGGKLAGEIAGTAGAGGLLAQGARAAGAAPSLVQALATSGMRAGGATGATGLATRVAGGGITGAAAAGMVDPRDAFAGGAIGAGLPVAGKAAMAASRGIGRSLRGGPISAEVANLARRAEQLGINIPADRIANSKALNAVASSLNYVPFSGRAAVEEGMQSQLNRALSRTFGQDSDNVTMALRQAQQQLGGEFDRVLSSNKVRVDSQFLDELAEHEATALRELGSDGAGIISRQIDEIMAKGATGELDGQAAYNVKKMLDRIGKRNSPEAHYATELRKSLMGALNRSIGPEAAEAFGQTRKQYGNMLALERLAQNGAEGEVSIGRLANMKNIGNQDLQELADIAAQFLKSREGNHGAAQRAVIGGVTAVASGPMGLAAGVAAGRGVNSVLKSQAAKKLVLNPAHAGLPIEVQLLLARGAPVLGSQ